MKLLMYHRICIFVELDILQLHLEKEVIQGRRGGGGLLV